MKIGAAISTLLTSLYAVYKATSVVTTLNTSIFRVYNGDNVNDTSGNAQNGTNIGSVTFTTGKIGNAFTFNGSNYISLPNNSLNSLTGDFSISMWVNVVNTGANQSLFSGKIYDGTNSYGIAIVNNGYNYIQICNGTSTVTSLQEASSNPYGTWYMVTVTRKASTGTKIYYNGTLSASNTSTTNPVFHPTLANKCAIGALDYSTSFGGVYYYCANGTKIDAVNVWNKELTGSEVTALYNSSSGLEYPFSTAITIDSANDSLDTYNGTAQGGLTYTAGKSGNAFTFNGTNAYISLPTNSFKFNSDFSICLWSKLAGNVVDIQTLFANYTYNGTYSYGYVFYYYNNALTFEIYNNSGVFQLNYTTGSLFGNWKNVVITRKYSTGTKMYIDGVLVASNTNTQNPNYHTTMTPAIGAHDYGPTFSNLVAYYTRNGGLIDEVNTWNKELSSTEVTELYNAGTGKFYPY